MVTFANADPGMIVSNHAQAVSNTQPVFNEEMSEIIRRVKILESNVSSVRTTVQAIEKKGLDTERDSTKDIKVLEAEIDEINASLREIKNTMKLMIADMQNFAKAEELKVVQGYLNLWNPVSFVTAQQVRKIINEVMQDGNIQK